MASYSNLIALLEGQLNLLPDFPAQAESLVSLIADLKIASGGGGGSGGGLTGGDVQSAIDASTDINAVVASLASIDSKLTTSNANTSTVATRATEVTLQAISNTLQPLTATRLGGISPASDIVLSGRIRRLVITNNSPSIIFVGFYSKASALAAVDVPVAGEIYPVPAANVLILGSGHFGDRGSQLPANPRLGISSSSANYVAPTMTLINAFVEIV